jgi:hypothetical protein
VPDRKSAIWIIKDHNPLACPRSCDLIRLQDEQQLRPAHLRTELVTPNKLDAAEMPTIHGFDEEFGLEAVAITFWREVS